VKVCIDEQPVEAGLVDTAVTVEEALRRLQTRLSARDQLVIGLRCDGRDIPSGDMAGTRPALVIDAMTQASTCLTQTEEACTRIVQLLQQGRIGEGAESLGSCLRLWQQIHEAVIKSLQMLNLDPERISIRDESMVQLLSRPKDVLVQIRDALAAKDYVLLADLLQYEFTEVTEAWHAAVARIRSDAEELRTARFG
jgi:hypothetical protein